MTLVEILVVVGVIVLLASMVIGIATQIGNQSKERATKSTFALLHGALQEYYDFWDNFPEPNKPSLTRSAALYDQLNSTPASQKILKEIDESLISDPNNVPQINDPWGKILDYRYVPGDNFPELISAGPDKIFDTVDDITNK